MQVYFGCPIWSARAWVGSFYPKGTKSTDYLREYVRRLTTVEGNTTFYAVPPQTTLDKWRAEMLPGFRFCPKIPKVISHSGQLAGHEAQAAEFVEAISQLGDRLGPIFLQLPPSYWPASFDDLQQFLTAWPAMTRLAVEVRHLRWFDPPHFEALNTLLQANHMARVVTDTRPIRSLAGDRILEGSVYKQLLEARERKPDVPVLPGHTGDLVFLRFIGHPSIEVDRPFFIEWAEYLAAQPEGTTAYVFCHCPKDALDPWLCREFHREVARRVSIAPLPWDLLEEEQPEQQPLL
jgi:uncharacterized protein YecE (DUF72 family)